MTLNGVINSPYFALFYRIFVYDVIAKQLLGHLGFKIYF